MRILMMAEQTQIQIDFTDRKAPILTQEEHIVWSAIRDRLGRDRALLGTVIAECAGIDYVTVRAIISHLVNFHGCLIASCSRGYYVPVTPDEVQTSTRSLRHRGIMILLRAARLQKSSIEDVFGQAKLELEKAC
ncbi:MAG: hypothetical protein M0R70_12765 [Nitrospirae bacterium]|nr:hypothetical protein [Nitrospirota bacterium]